MASEHDEKEIEAKDNGTPSTASRIKPAAVESVFPTPARKERTGSVESRGGERASATAARTLGFDNTSSTPQKHKSIEALRNQAAKAFSNKQASSADTDATWQRREVSKKNSQYFDEAFAVRPPYNNAKDRVARDSILVVELHLNFNIDHEGKERNFLADFLMTLGEIYQRPTNNIMITAVTDAQIMLGGSTESAYLLTVTALPSEIAPIKNQRTTAILQEYLSEALPVPSHRGVVKFCPVKEENLATNGMTIQREIEKLEQKTAEEKRSLGLKSRQSNRASRKSTILRSETPINGLDMSRSGTPILIMPTKTPTDQQDLSIDRAYSTGKMPKGRKSIMSFWKRNGS